MLLGEYEYGCLHLHLPEYLNVQICYLETVTFKLGEVVKNGGMLMNK